MWLQIQSAVRRTTCDEITPVNAVVDAVTCDTCGARLDLGRGLWVSALGEWTDRGRALDPQATYRSTLDQRGGRLVATVGRLPPRCPHCDKPWPDDARGLIEDEAHACPHCKGAVSVRPPEEALGGDGLPGLVVLVGEDRMQLAGQRAATEVETLSCGGCGAPLAADGSTRRLVCGSCAREAVLPDEIWRRVHAPTAVGRWYLWLAGKGRRAGLSEPLAVGSMASDVNGQVYLTGSYGDTSCALLALDTGPLRLKWMVDLEQLVQAETSGKIACAPDGRLVWHTRFETTLHWFDAATGAHQGSTVAPMELLDVAPTPDGTLAVCAFPLGKLSRLTPDGESLPMWPPLGWLASLWGPDGGNGGPPEARMASVQVGHIAWGHDGEMRIISLNVPGQLGLDGTLRWVTPVEKVVACLVPPAAAADGTTWLVLSLEEHSVLVRITSQGRQVDTVLVAHPHDPFIAMTVTPEGHVWVATARGGLSVLDRDGGLLEHHAGTPLDD